MSTHRRRHEMNSATRRHKRRLLLQRDGAACFYCARPFGSGEPFSRPTFDHVMPVSRGGTNALTNLVLACKPCNESKGDELWAA
jgi:5-methylcytosine-specific restriction endonuclease McrA